MIVQIPLAFVAMLVTGAQALLLYFVGEGICFNDGCGIVERMTTIPSLYFNAAGFGFFLVVWLSLTFSKNGSVLWLKFARLLLLAGLAAEAVLVYFQYRIAGVFCSYCLIILSFIVLLNLLSGARQIFRGMVIFAAVFLACMSLQFQGPDRNTDLNAGTLARYSGAVDAPELTLFFSKSCPHCEEIIDSLDDTLVCSIAFNPIDPLTKFELPLVEATSSYQPMVNLSFLKSLGIYEIPVMLAKDGEAMTVLRGALPIKAYLKENCQEPVALDELQLGSSKIAGDGYKAYLPAGVEDDNCQVETDCSEGETADVQAR